MKYTQLSTAFGLPGAKLTSFPVLPGNLSLAFELGITQAPLPFASEYPRCQQFITGLNLKVEILDSAGNALDVSDATRIKFRLGLPNGTQEDRAGTFVSDGSDGLVQYPTQFGDLAKTGLYSIQVQIETPTGKLPTSKSFFWVMSNVDNN